MSDYTPRLSSNGDTLRDRYFTFYNPGILIDGDLELVLVETIFPEQNPIDYIPVYKFEMRQVGTTERLGRISFRVANTEDIQRFAGL